MAQRGIKSGQIAAPSAAFDPLGASRFSRGIGSKPDHHAKAVTGL